MRTIRVAINGFGRIGRLSLRTLLKQPNVELVAVNDIADPATLAHLLKYDSNYGPWDQPVSHDAGHIFVAGKPIAVFAESDPARLPWEKLGIDTVLESTGRFLDRPSVRAHQAAGAKRVVLAAPPQDDIPMVVLGVNEAILSTAGTIVSNASCTTNCLAPLAHLLHTHFTIESGYINTVHAYTADQRLHDAPHKDLRRARAAAKSIIPTTTGAARSIGKIIPDLEGKLDGIALRVPVSDGSLLDFTVYLKKSPSKEQINAVVKAAAAGAMREIIAYTEDPIVSVDVIGNPHSCIFDASLTFVNHHLAKVIAWYDNEMGYAHRLADLIGQFSS